MGRRSPGGGAVGLSLKIFCVALVAVGVVVAAVAGSRWLAEAPSDRPAVDLVDRGRATFVAEQRDRYARLAAVAGLLSREPTLQEVLRGDPLSGRLGRGAGGEDGREALADLLFQRREDLGFDFAVVLDADGRVVAANEEADLVDLLDRDVSARALVARGLEEGAGRGVWRRGDGRLAHAAIEWVTPEFDLLGYVVVGLDVSEVLALEIQRTSGAGVAFLADRNMDGGGGVPGLRTIASTFDAASAERLADQLLAPSGDVAAVFDGDDTHQGVEVDLGAGFGGGGVYEALLAPLRDARGGLVGAALIAAPAGGAAADPTLLWTAIGAAAALFLSLLLAALLARGTLAPVRRLTGMVDAAPREGFARHPEPRRAGPLAPLADALGRLFRGLQEERALSAAASAAAVQGAGEPEAGEGGTAATDDAREEKAAVLAVDLKRYAAPGARAGDAREVAARWQRDVVRTRELVRAAGGRLETAAGHRLYATFGGDADGDLDDATWRAVEAGSSVVTALARGESAFDEGEPPAVAVVSGRITRGTGAGGRPLLVGSALQLAESLLREASAGDLVLPRAVHRTVRERLAASGVEAGEQRALLSPQPLFVLRPAAASRLAEGGAGSGARAVSAAGEPGDVLEDRFEVVERVASGPPGDLLRVVDRELGRQVALKRLTAGAVTRDDAVGLESPLAAVRRFTHPSLAELYEFGTLRQDGPFAGGVYLARAWVPGVPLHRVGELPATAGLAVGRRLAAVLAEVHGAGLHHGRVKPGNLILVPGERVWLTDLGVALLVGSGASSPQGERLLAPEQAAGAPGDARSDVFATGALLARLVSGRWWSGEEAQPGGDLPPGLDEILRRCLAEDPDARYPHAGSLYEALDAISV